MHPFTLYELAKGEGGTTEHKDNEYNISAFSCWPGKKEAKKEGLFFIYFFDI
jgi:hypothetical protein